MAGDASAGGDADAADGTDIDLVLVAAVAENRVIGDDGGMPWHYPADLARFKRLTTGHPVIVGRATYESIADRIGGPLPDRTSVVLTTRDLDLPEGAVVANDLDEAVDLAAPTPPTAVSTTCTSSAVRPSTSSSSTAPTGWC